MKTRNKVITALILGGGAYVAANALMDQPQHKITEPSDRNPGAVALRTKLDVNIYDRNNTLLGVLNKGSCVVARTPFADDASGFRSVTVNTAKGAVNGAVSARLLDQEGAGAVEGCKSEMRQVFADSTKPETKNLPVSQTYFAPKSTPLYFGPTTPPSGLYAGAGSCVTLMTKGHSDKMFHVMVSDDKRMGDVYVSKDAVVPIGDYNWDKGCNAYISGTVINHRPKAPAEPAKEPEMKTPAEPTKAPEAKTPAIHNGDLFVVTADRVELRSGPGADFGSLNTIFKDSCVQAMGGKDNKNGFVKVLTSYDQKHYQKGFVSRDSLKPTPQGLGKMECFIR